MNCPDCGDPEHEAPIGDCGHQAKTDLCHRAQYLHCPHHFTNVAAKAMAAALPGYGTDTPHFVAHLDHLNRDGYLESAFYMWAGLVGRYAVGEDETQEAFLARKTKPTVPPDAPEYLHQVASLVTYISRGAITGDMPTIEAAWQVAIGDLSPRALVSVLASMAASAHVVVETSPACTSSHLTAYHLLGSQVSNVAGLAVLPFLAEMVAGHDLDKPELVVEGFHALMELPNRPLVSAVDVVSRALGQMIDPDVMVVTGSDFSSGDMTKLTGLINPVHANPQELSREHAAGLWAVRAAHAYAGATGPDDATDRIRAVARDHGHARGFGIDVVAAAVGMLGETLSDQERPLGEDGPERPVS